MRRFLAVILLLTIMITSLSGCKKNKYKPIESTEEEAQVILSLSLGGNTYNVRYELYRTLFLTYKSEIDGGDPTVWAGENKDVYIELINERIIGEAAEIFAVFELCARLGIDCYSEQVEDEISEMIKVSVEGGSFGDGYYEGFGGDYDEYLASLRDIYHNYQTALLLMRYSIAKRLIDEHYIGSALADDGSGRITDGAIDYTKDTVRDFYNSDESAQILTTYVAQGVSYTPRELAEDIRLDVINAAKTSTNAVRITMINRGSPTAVGELESGIFVGRHSLSRDYEKIAEVACELSVGGVGEVIETVSSLDGRRYYIVYKMEKSEEFFTAKYTEIVEVYLYNTIGTSLSLITDMLKNGATYTENYDTITHSEVRM